MYPSPFSLVSLLFFIIRPPPISTLFPYTTLFRSRGRRRRQLDRLHERAVSRRIPHREADPLQDRKSTRLNSSHRCISYAVFCLKKKNIAGKTPRGKARDQEPEVVRDWLEDTYLDN